MKRLAALFGLTLWTLSAKNASAGQIGGTEQGWLKPGQRFVTGRLTDGIRGVGSATVVLLREGEQTAGTTADTLGRFALAADTGTYLFCVRHVAYGPIKKTIRLSTEGTELGDIRLEEEAIGEVIVTAQQVTREADRFIVTINDTPAVAGKDGTELLADAPGVWLDDKGLSINGARGTQLFVNGSELKLSAEETTAYLRSLPAADIARIEVVPQAGAEYAADARGGVILLILRRRRTNGLSGHIQVSASLSPLLQNYAPSASISAHTGHWTLSASGAGNFMPRGDSRFEERRHYSGSEIRFLARTEGGSRNNYGRGRLGAVCDLNDSHTVGIEAEYTSKAITMPFTAQTAISTADAAQQSRSRYRQHAAEERFSATFNYIWKIDTLGSELKFIADYTRHAAGGDNGYFTMITAAAISRDSTYRSNSASRYDVLAADLAFTHKFSRSLTFRTGAKYTRNGMDDRSGYQILRAAQWQELPVYGYTMRYTEQTGAVYATLITDIRRWNITAGLRAEYTSTSARNFRKSYFDLFPNASLSYAFNDIRSWMLVAQYARNIERPSFPSMNPARIQLSDYSYQTGNPRLRPTYMHRVSLTAVYKYRFTLTVGGNLHRDLIREVARTDDEDPNVVRIEPANHYAEDHWFAAASLPFQPTRWWKLAANLVGVMQRIELARRDTPQTHYLYFINALSGFTLPKGFYIELSYNGQSRLYSGNSDIGPRHILSATVKKQFAEGRLTLFASVRNMTGCGMEFGSTTQTFHRIINSEQAWTGRIWKVGLTLNFRSGRKFRDRTVESSATGERKRIERPTGQ